MKKMKPLKGRGDTPIYFIFCYARSGGTLLNKCLANIKNLIVLSEVHPINDSVDRGIDLVSIASQTRKWYGIELQSIGYLAQIKELKRICDEQGKFLVIRDWSFIDFTPNSMNDYMPVKEPSAYNLLKSEFNMHAIAFVRNAIDIGLSQGENLDVFSNAYLDYIRFLLKDEIEIFKYEHFCARPDEVLRSIGERLNIPSSNNWNALAMSGNVMGDISVSRGNVKKKVVQMKRQYAPPWVVKRINDNQKIYEANKLLGYSLVYEAEERERRLDLLLFLINKVVKRLKFK